MGMEVIVEVTEDTVDLTEDIDGVKDLPMLSPMQMPRQLLNLRPKQNPKLNPSLTLRLKHISTMPILDMLLHITDIQPMPTLALATSLPTMVDSATTLAKGPLNLSFLEETEEDMEDMADLMVATVLMEVADTTEEVIDPTEVTKEAMEDIVVITDKQPELRESSHSMMLK